MLIRNYYYKEADHALVIAGTHTISVPAAWCVWRDALCSYPDKVAFLDIPVDQKERVILLALPGEPYRRIMFSVSMNDVREMKFIFTLYDALLSVDPAQILASVEKQEPFELNLKAGSLPENAALPIFSSDLNGLQLIGNTRQALLTVAKMLCQNQNRVFRINFCLAVNPPRYNDAFTTVVSEEMPEGEWQKLRSEHTDYSSATVFHDRRRDWIRKHQRPRIVLQIMIFLVCLLALGVICMHFLRKSQSFERENQQLKEKNLKLEFELQQIRHSFEINDQKNNPDNRFPDWDHANAEWPAAQSDESAPGSN